MKVYWRSEDKHRNRNYLQYYSIQVADFPISYTPSHGGLLIEWLCKATCIVALWAMNAGAVSPNGVHRYDMELLETDRNMRSSGRLYSFRLHWQEAEYEGTFENLKLEYIYAST